MAAPYKGPLDYIDVATRIVEFREKFPDGSLQQVSLEFVKVADKDWVVFTAAAYRTPDDIRPGIGTAWEPVPGATNFTRNSEVQNAETAAWGRAMVAALAVDTKKGIASQEEVRNRSAENEAQSAPVAVDPVLVDEWVSAFDDATTIAQLQAAWEGAGKAGVTQDKRVIAAKDKKKAALANG
jgi:hypothetical protein